MNKILRPALYVAGTLAAIACLAAAAGYLEYRTNVVAKVLGDYLAGTNRSRASTGRLWELIASENEARRALPDSISTVDEIPSDLPANVRYNRLSLERIPEVGMPGYLAILAHAVPPAERDIVDTRRLVDGSRHHRLGRSVLDHAKFDATAFTQEARRQATEMARKLDASDLQTALKSDIRITGATIEREDSLRTPEASLRTLSLDSISTSVIETFVSVILEDRLDRLKTRILKEWDDGQIEQLFLNHGLGAFEGELYYSDQTRPRITFRVSSENVAAILGLPTERAAP